MIYISNTTYKANMPSWPRLSKNHKLFQHPSKLSEHLLLELSCWLEAVTRRHNKGMDGGMRRRKPSQRIRKMSEWYNLVACFCACYLHCCHIPPTDLTSKAPFSQYSCSSMLHSESRKVMVLKTIHRLSFPLVHSFIFVWLSHTIFQRQTEKSVSYTNHWYK